MKQLFILMTMLATTAISAQKTLYNDTAIQMTAGETVFLHANATAFVPGESLLYKLYCQTNYAGGLTSKVGYVELVNSDHKVIFSNKLFFDDGAADGDFFIGPALPTGHYKLLGYTNAILNNPSKIFQLDIHIINPFQVSGKTPVDATQSPVSAGTPLQSEFDLIGSAKSFAKRQQISLNLQRVLQRYPNSNLSLSVRKHDNLGAAHTMSATEYSQIRWLNTTKEIKVLPEWRGEMITGSISGASNRNVPVALSIPGKNFEFKVANTDANGKFIFNIDNAHPRQDIFVQVIGADRGAYTVSTQDRPVPEYSNLQINEYFPGPQHAEAIRERSVAAQIQNAYFTRKADTLAFIQPDMLFYETVQRKFVLDDYTRFPTFAQTIIEVIEGAYFEQKNGVYSLFVRDNNPGREITAPTLVLVDGLMLQDNTDLFAYKASGIAHISTFSGVYLYGPTAFNGVISVVTKNQDFVANDKSIAKANILRPAPKKKLFKQLHDNSPEDQKIPDYRYQLLWQPKVDKPEVSFYSSDVGGTFDLVVEGFAADGEPVSIRERFIVE